jgi:cysteine desulfurase
MQVDDWIYLDYNASTPMAPEVLAVMTDSLKDQAHPSSKHPAGERTAAIVSHARRQVAASLGCQPEEIVFCSGSTEASNHVIKGVAFARSRQGPLHFITSAVDHPATIEPLRFLERIGHQLTVLPVDSDGLVTASQVEAALTANTVMVSLLHAQNEVGTLMPLQEIGDLCRARGVLFHVDAAQSFGKVPVSVDELRADFLQIAGHKIYAPKGVGALFIRQGRQLEPLLHGAGHERGARSGTPAPALIAGLAEACRLVAQLGPVPALPAERMWEILAAQLGEKVRRNGHPQWRAPNVLHLTFDGYSGQSLLDAARLCASTGAACHSAAASPVLSAMGFTPSQAAGSVRLSTGRPTSLQEAEEAARRLVQAVLSADGNSPPAAKPVP